MVALVTVAIKSIVMETFLNGVAPQDLCIFDDNIITIACTTWCAKMFFMFILDRFKILILKTKFLHVTCFS